MSKNERKFMLILLIFIGIVLGGLVGEFAAKKGIWWLNYGKEFGFPSPVTLDLNVIKFTFSFAINLTVSTIIGVILGILTYHYIN